MAGVLSAPGNMPDTMFRPENISRTVLTTCSSMSSKRASPPVSIVMLLFETLKGS
jgi:hypothetical protein